MQKLIPLLLIFFGESLAIYSEVIAAKNISDFNVTLWKMSGIMAIAGLLLISGYMLGLKSLQDIWIISAVSIASIIIMEPIVTYFLFRELPSKGAVTGLILGISGLLAALFIK